MGVKSFSLHRPLPVIQRLDVWPFLLLHLLNLGTFVYSCVSDGGNVPQHGAGNTSTNALDKDVTFFLGCRVYLINYATVPFLCVVHLVVHLGTYWSVRFKVIATMRKVREIKDASIVKVVPSKSNEKIGLCDLTTVVLGRAAGSEEMFYAFEFHKRKYLWEPGERKFAKVAFPVGESMGSYRSGKGLTSPEEVEDATARWGANSFEIPLPKFGELYREQCRQPFFVFQIACVGLWSMDEYVQYSLLTLFMLLLFEGTVVLTRTRNLRMLREMMGSATRVRVLRRGVWTVTGSEALLPGDLVSIARNRFDPDAGVPADLLLLSGRVVVNEAILTGEATPQPKESVAHRPPHDRLLLRRAADTGDKGHVIFGGTKVLLAMPEPDTLPKGIPRPPDAGCVGYVLRNGFNTAQGRLVRTILFSTEQTTAASRDAGIFISVLLVFAVAAAGFVLQAGWHDERRSRAKLLLNCSMIVASVVPPELPMNLSLAVNASIASLARLGVFCTEPFRIPFAGKVGVCCFDKTGTLTSEELQLQGVAGVASPNAAGVSLLTPPDALPDETVQVLVGCHSLLYIDDELSGETMERAAMQRLDWGLSKGDVSSEKGGRRRRIEVVHRFPFASSLGRMATLVEMSEGGGRAAGARALLALAKGAPEVMMQRFTDVPPFYEKTFKHFARQGARVLALGWKRLDPQPLSKVKAMRREEAECGLTFAGLVVFHCPHKIESAPSLRELRASGHHLVMITGDQVLTACHVARHLGMCAQAQSLVLAPTARSGGMEWVSTDEETRIPVELPAGAGADSWGAAAGAGPAALFGRFDLCVSGPTLALLPERAQRQLIGFVRVFARVSPSQKEQILLTLRDLGHFTLMCGDGTNDVGALKASHVGVALLAGPSLQDASLQRPAAEDTAGDPGAPGGRAGQRQVSMRELQVRLERQMAEEEPALVRLGDASIASPFTCRQSSIYPTTRIIQQGRCTLVTTMQIYKIQALTCLTLAYCLSALYLDGVKLGDSQMMLSGLLSAVLFFTMSNAKPLDTLAPQRPPSTICCTYMVLTIAGQFAVHLSVLLAAIDMTRPHRKVFWVCSGDSTNSTVAKELGEVAPPCAGPCDELGCNGCLGGTCVSDRDPDANFSPNLLNSVVFLITTITSVTTFLVNYKGRPYMIALKDNKLLLYTLLFGWFTIHACVLEVVPDFNAYLQLVPMPDEAFKLRLVLLMLFDVAVSFVVEKVSAFFFYRSACRTVTDSLLSR